MKLQLEPGISKRDLEDVIIISIETFDRSWIPKLHSLPWHWIIGTVFCGIRNGGLNY